MGWDSKNWGNNEYRSLKTPVSGLIIIDEITREDGRWEQKAKSKKPFATVNIEYRLANFEV